MTSDDVTKAGMTRRSFLDQAGTLAVAGLGRRGRGRQNRCGPDVRAGGDDIQPASAPAESGRDRH